MALAMEFEIDSMAVLEAVSPLGCPPKPSAITNTPDVESYGIKAAQSSLTLVLAGERCVYNTAFPLLKSNRIGLSKSVCV